MVFDCGGGKNFSARFARRIKGPVARVKDQTASSNHEASPGRRNSSHHHTPEAVAVDAKAERAEGAAGRRETAAIVIAPRTAAQHAAFTPMIRVPVFTPLPHIPSKIVEPITVGGITAHGRGEQLLISKSTNQTPESSLVYNRLKISHRCGAASMFLSHVVPHVVRWWPLITPRIRAAARRRAPLRIRRQAVFPPLLLAQPRDHAFASSQLTLTAG